MVADLKLGSVGSEVQPMSEGIASFTCCWSLAAELITSAGKLGTKRGREEREEGKRKEGGGWEMRQRGREKGKGRGEEKRGRRKRREGGGREEREEEEKSIPKNSMRSSVTITFVK